MNTRFEPSFEQVHLETKYEPIVVLKIDVNKFKDDFQIQNSKRISCLKFPFWGKLDFILRFK